MTFSDGFVDSAWFHPINPGEASVMARALFAFVLLAYLGKMRATCNQALVAFFTIGWLFSSEALIGRLIILLGVVVHAPMAPKRSVLLTLAWLVWESDVPGVSQDLKSFIVLGFAVLAVRRVALLLLTLSASSPASLLFIPLSHLMPRYSFSDKDFFRADNCSLEIAGARERSFDALQVHWSAKWPKSLETSAFLATSFSDLRFMSSNRVFLPFQRKIEGWCDPCTVVERAEGPWLIDVDGNRLLDISGSYGVNVCGYGKYQEFLAKGAEMVKNLGPVLGPVSPLLCRNIELMQKISMKEEISWHMSGTEAVMAGIRLCRFNTGRPLVVVFSGAYHGWWDGVQPLAGNERVPADILTLTDMSPKSLMTIKLRYREIAAVVVNALQAFHPNQPPPSDLALATNNRETSDSTLAYKNWLHSLRETCSKLGIVFFFDEVFTGARLAQGGAQEYFSINADMVAYGKTFGGGQAIGMLAGPRKLMSRGDPDKPLRVAYVVGTFAAAPLTLACQNLFLNWLLAEDTKKIYERLRREVAAWRDETNETLKREFDGEPPIAVQSYGSVWTIMYLRPSRYNFLLQYYLRDEGLNLSWVGTGRLCFSLDFTANEFGHVREALIKSCRRMESDHWWVRGVNEGGAIKTSLAKEVGKAMLKRLMT